MWFGVSHKGTPGGTETAAGCIVPAILSTPAGRRDLSDIIARPRAPPAWAQRTLIVRTSRTKRSADFIALLEEVDRRYGPKRVDRRPIGPGGRRSTVRWSRRA